MNPFRCLAGALLASACLVSISNSQEKEKEKDKTTWESHSHKIGKFKINLPPGKPNEQIIDIPVGDEKIKLFIFGVESETQSFLVGYCDYPKEIVEKGDPEDLLDGVMKGMLEGMKGKEKSTEKIKIEGFSARELSFTIPDAKATGKARAFLVKNRLYQIIAFEAKEKPEKVDDFLKSFSLLKEEKK